MCTHMFASVFFSLAVEMLAMMVHFAVDKIEEGSCQPPPDSHKHEDRQLPEPVGLRVRARAGKQRRQILSPDPGHGPWPDL